MAAVIILELKNNPKISEFMMNIESQFQNYGFQRVSDIPTVYLSVNAGTTELNKVLRLVRAHPDYRACVQKCYNNVLRVV